MKIAMLLGHSRRKEGAKVCAGFYEGYGENALADHYLPLMCMFLQDYGFDVKLTQRSEAGGVTPSYSAKAANATGADIALEWHFNSAGKSVSGCEVLYWHKSSKGKRFAELLSARLATMLGVPDRGAKPIGSESDRGYRAFRDSRMPFYMIEPCFAGSNPEDAKKFGKLIKSGDWQQHGAVIVAETINEIYGKE